jgi:DNA (cytosine-5)-methyltransferase 1
VEEGLLLSLFCGAGGLDLGFEQAGFEVGLAFDINADSVESYNHNRAEAEVAKRRSVKGLSPTVLDTVYGRQFLPTGLIGGPPCQSFSRASSSRIASDPRHTLPYVYARLLKRLNRRQPIPFFAFENVPGLLGTEHNFRFRTLIARLTDAGFCVNHAVLNAKDYRTPQNRERLIIVGFNRKLFGELYWTPPRKTTRDPQRLTVADAIAGFAKPVIFERDLDPSRFKVHPNHWCMKPRSAKFKKAGALVEGDGKNRSFKTLAWDQPSLTVAYGNREVHIHPNCKRRLSVFEAMLLQGFPEEYELCGSLSSQIRQVSEAVPPPLAEAIAVSIRNQIAQARIERLRARKRA